VLHNYDNCHASIQAERGAAFAQLVVLTCLGRKDSKLVALALEILYRLHFSIGSAPRVEKPNDQGRDPLDDQAPNRDRESDGQSWYLVPDLLFERVELRLGPLDYLFQDRAAHAGLQGVDASMQ
jgi:hypothetical protein